MTTYSGRLSILSPQEIDDLFAIPRFSAEERRLYFDLSGPERAAVQAVRTVPTAIHLILQCGYFKAKRRFFVYEQDEVQDDLRFIIHEHFPDRDPGMILITTLSKPTRLEQQESILRLFDYRLCDAAAKEQLKRKMERAAMLSTQPLYVLREALRHLNNERVVAPGYSFLQDLVGRVVTAERQRITNLLGQALTPTVKEQLDALLHADEGMYRISALKHEAKDFSYGQLRQEGERRDLFRPLYEFAQTFLMTTGLSNESVKYYASLVQFYTVYKLQRMAAPTTRLYLLCFAYHRFRQINNTLLEAFVHLLGQYEKQARLAAEDAVHKALTEAGERLAAAGHVLDLFVDEAIPDATPFASVKDKAFSMLDPASFPIGAR